MWLVWMIIHHFILKLLMFLLYFFPRSTKIHDGGPVSTKSHLILNHKGSPFPSLPWWWSDIKPYVVTYFILQTYEIICVMYKK